MSHPLVSVLVPAFNVERYLPVCIDSLVMQSLSDIEIIIVDDGSEDDTIKVAHRLARQDNRIALHRIPHSGHAAAFNEALRHARGEIIARQDADDWSDRNRLLKSISELERTNADLVTCKMVRVMRDGAHIDCRSTRMNPLAYLTDPVPRGPVSASIVATREVYETIGGLPEGVGSEIGAADSTWNFLSLSARPRLEWAFVPEVLYYYRDHCGQCTKRDGGIGQRVHKNNQLSFRNRVLRNWSNGQDTTGDVSGPELPARNADAG